MKMNVKLLATSTVFVDDEWITFSPQNIYTASSHGDKYIIFRFKEEIREVAEFAKFYQRPDIMKKILLGKDLRNEFEKIKNSIGLSKEPLFAKVASYNPQWLSIEFEGEMPSWISKAGELRINGEKINLQLVEKAKNKIFFLGSDQENLLEKGLNMVSDTKNKVTFWFEEQKLKKFKDPYKKSVALIIAIDDYERKNDAKKQGSTGLPALSRMVDDAQKLVLTLKKLGFPEQNIITLYNSDATSDAINDTLMLFWEGHKFAKQNVDRLFFYFGGHGEISGNTPYLVTYDHNKDTPTTTSLPMEDLTQRHSKNIKANHALFVLEACYSGDVTRFLSQKSRWERFRKLSIIRREIEQKARNILVAGTGDQKALWKNGGIFTKYLIEGLNGEADANDDKIIFFEELGSYVKNHVTPEASSHSVRQDPDYKKLEQFGKGNVFFIRHY